MARRINSFTTMTPTAFADGSNYTDALYPFLIQGGTASQLNYIWEISISGQASGSSTPTFMILARDSTIAATNSLSTGQNDAAMDSLTAAITAAALTGTTNTTKPQRSSSLHLLNCSLNAYGGNFFWRANRVEECVKQYGASVNVGETSLSAFTGGTPGAIGTHTIYESV